MSNVDKLVGLILPTYISGYQSFELEMSEYLESDHFISDIQPPVVPQW